jgi:hypothetical protein
LNDELHCIKARPVIAAVYRLRMLCGSSAGGASREKPSE